MLMYGITVRAGSRSSSLRRRRFRDVPSRQSGAAVISSIAM
jgi:hypothetical protein